MTDDIYIGAVGVEIRLDTGIDLTGASLLQIKYKKPDGSTTGAWTAAQYGATTSITYTTQESGDPAEADLDQAGEWLFQAYVEFGDPATQKHYGLTYVLKVRSLWEVVDA